MKGTLITLKRDVFKTQNRISANLETLGPLFLKNLQSIPAIHLSYIE